MNMKKISALLALTFVSSNATLTAYVPADVLAHQNAALTGSNTLVGTIMDKLPTAMATVPSISFSAHTPFAHKQVDMAHGSLFGGGNPTIGGALTSLAGNLNMKSMNTSSNAANSTSVGNTNSRTIHLVPTFNLQPTHTGTNTTTASSQTI